MGSGFSSTASNISKHNKFRIQYIILYSKHELKWLNYKWACKHKFDLKHRYCQMRINCPDMIMLDFIVLILKFSRDIFNAKYFEGGGWLRGKKTGAKLHAKRGEMP